MIIFFFFFSYTGNLRACTFYHHIKKNLLENFSLPPLVIPFGIPLTLARTVPTSVVPFSCSNPATFTVVKKLCVVTLYRYL